VSRCCGRNDLPAPLTRYRSGPDDCSDARQPFSTSAAT
jgi:hypothetical protein